MEFEHLIDLISQLQPGSQLKYVRGKETCTFLRLDKDINKVYAKTPKNDDATFSESFLSELAKRIEPRVPFNTSQLLNNRGTNRAVIDCIIANTAEIYWLDYNRSRYTVWIPDVPHDVGELAEWKDLNSITITSAVTPNVSPLSTILFDDDNKKHYTEDELIQILTQMYNDGENGYSKTVNLILFGLKYGKSITNATQLCQKAKIPLSTPVNNGVSLYKLIRDKKYGVGFFDKDMNIEEVQKGKQKWHGNLNLHSAFLQYFTAIRTKPFMLLAGISGTGKSRIVRKLAQATVTEDLQRKYDSKYKCKDFSQDRWRLHSPTNFCLIQVKPNWHNSMDVIGYLSNVPEPHYVFTPFVNFVIKAWQNPGIPFFLCLDEMNLAPVEEYFAEFLSAIESRSKENNVYETDPIIKPFNEFGNKASVDMIHELNSALGFELGNQLEEQLRTKGLTLPENLIVIGTVNMDETTFSFSRKVLDRAMSVEMNDVDYDGFLHGTTDDELKEIVDQMHTDRLDKLLVDRHIEAQDVISHLGDDANTAVNYLKQINTLLDGTQFKLGYRAANEALIYIQSAKDFGVGSLEEILDSFTLMKILSRLEGDTTKLRLTIEDNEQQLKDAQINTGKAEEHGELSILTALRYIIESNLGRTQLNSIKKLDSMIHQLARDHFVSFWN